MAKKPKQQEADVQAEQPVVMAIKGFNPNLTCRDYQFEIGKTHKHEGTVEACSGGFHAIEGHPLEVFQYYAPGVSVYHDVELRGPFSRHSEDSKIAAAEITIKAEIKIPGIRIFVWKVGHNMLCSVSDYSVEKDGQYVHWMVV